MKLVANDTIGNFKVVCENTSLVETYKGICDKYPCERESKKTKFDTKELLELFRGLGYEVKYYSRDWFYSIRIPSDIGWVGCEMEIRRGTIVFRLIIDDGEDSFFPSGALGYWIREIAGVETLIPSMVTFDEAIDMLNIMVGVLKEILDKWERD